ncbi:hypothetical protein [Novosphingobium sp.]|jgi:outer membrane biosynthesis protein TonB|uniref:hypothetical protein n=1 Tax=Novosphingobium sp. TaxID=1874826 RepID=UPI001ECE6A24|nr:hypothetical protein [Novosphingobium sp.]MBK6803003.1 hypothetical protein [Novosphingobium sp.]MBK9012148.1 hypothetical protein [Novosphingobium sp.]
MAAAVIRKEELAGLALALGAHAALVALLALNPPAPAPMPLPERMTVTISDDVGLTSTSPEPSANAAAASAPELGEPAPPAAEPEPAPVQPKVLQPQPPAPKPPAPKPLPPKPAPQPVVQPRPVPPKPQPRPVPKVAPAPAPRPVAKAPPQPAARPVASRPAATPARTPPAKAPPRPAGADRLGNDFLEGVRGATGTGKSTNPPAAAIGPAVKSALAGSISRQLKPRWVAPQGAEAELLVTVLAWDLNPDGTLNGSPRVVRQEGITDANRAQAQRHAEQAIRAVRLAAPFNLPPQYYSAWKRVSDFRFDRKLSQ